MQQRQLRLGVILADYCPRERRLTNHAVVAMVGPDVKQTRCTTCDAEHEHKQAKAPRHRKKPDTPPALYAQALAGGPKKVAHESDSPTEADVASEHDVHDHDTASTARQDEELPAVLATDADQDAEETRAIDGPELDDDDDAADGPAEEGP